MNIYIIGLGLIGSSIARSIKKNQLEHKIYGCDINLDSVNYALQENIIDELFSYKTFQLDSSADSLIIVAASPTVTANIFEELKDLFHLDNLAITDVCSVKNHLIDAMHGIHESNVVLSHPMAGSHLSGVRVGEADLFRGRYVLLSPLHCTEHALRTVAEFWQSLDGITHAIKAEKHDELLAATSHLPHILVYALLHHLQAKQITDLAKVSGGGLQSLLRIGSSSTKMWRDIFLLNKDNITKEIDAVIDALGLLKEYINQEPESLEDLLNSLKDFKEQNT
ncbi:MAG: prephenate dehydrogenase/arogenate dehydrogenase family protein [Gammaproteobacteria bacterium]